MLTDTAGTVGLDRALSGEPARAVSSPTWDCAIAAALGPRTGSAVGLDAGLDVAVVWQRDTLSRRPATFVAVADEANGRGEWPSRR